eukprot:1610948-Amphidinium_carterae.2
MVERFLHMVTYYGERRLHMHLTGADGNRLPAEVNATVAEVASNVLSVQDLNHHGIHVVFPAEGEELVIVDRAVVLKRKNGVFTLALEWGIPGNIEGDLVASVEESIDGEMNPLGGGSFGLVDTEPGHCAYASWCEA